MTRHYSLESVAETTRTRKQRVKLVSLQQQKMKIYRSDGLHGTGCCADLPKPKRGLLRHGHSELATPECNFPLLYPALSFLRSKPCSQFGHNRLDFEMKIKFLGSQETQNLAQDCLSGRVRFAAVNNRRTFPCLLRAIRAICLHKFTS